MVPPKSTGATNSPLETVVLDSSAQLIEHRFDNTVVMPRQVRMYGDFTLQSLDLSASGARRIRLPEPLHCERFSLCGGSCPLEFAPLLDGVFRMDLSRHSCGTLLPLAECRQLMTLDLTDADVSRAVVDEYLIRLVTHHYGRRNCDLTLPVVPSGTYAEPVRNADGECVPATGLEAVWLLTHEESWNEGRCLDRPYP